MKMKNRKMEKLFYPSIITSIILLSILILCIFLHAFVIRIVYPIDLTPVVRISNGPVQGKFIKYEKVKVAHFLGIPFAKPPIGPLRFQLPVKPDNWTSVKQVVNYGSPCLQRSQHITVDRTNENCLFLNVYVTESTLKSSNSTFLRPVLFWIYGGALTFGFGNDYYSGIPIVPLHEVVLVTHNYRLNAFGFMHFGDKETRIPPNIGLKDQLLALQWVKENIDKFGGDPDQVTIFGESAGAMSVSAHILSPLSRGLFKRAILQSGTIMFPVEDPDYYIENGFTLLGRTSCASSTDLLNCLQSLPASTIMNAQSDGLLTFRWFYGDDFLPYSPSEAFSKGMFDNSLDILLGVEQNEFAMFMGLLSATQFNPKIDVTLNYSQAVDYLRLIFKEEAIGYFTELYFNSSIDLSSAYLLKQLIQAYSDTIIVCPTYMFGVEYWSKGGQETGKVYGYYHTQKPIPSYNTMCDDSPWTGICHGSDLTYVFGHPLVEPGYPQKDIDLSREMMKIWTHFAEFGYMPRVNEKEWKPLNEDLSAMVLNIDNLGEVERERIAFCVQQWDELVQNNILNFTYIMSAV
ncbi:acetylcholinesterase-like [Tetranychus urticae]|uniref:Carboxylic ester hydrolase n=1 Tax=Tetranychus urticae TaxID=32264 RepID=T1K786_TETUR|nr:acetylcholinesterase-like [Tetranychus urticae]